MLARTRSLCPSPQQPGNGTRIASAGPGFEVGDHVIVTRRMSPSVSLPGQPDFRRDLTVGATAIIETLEDAQHLAKVEIKATIMHRAVAHEIKTWVLRQNLARPEPLEGALIDCEAAGGNTDTPLTPLGSAPAYIANGHAHGVKVARVQNVATCWMSTRHTRTWLFSRRKRRSS